MTLLDIAVLVALLGGNALLAVLTLRNGLATVAILNLVPLFLGGRTNIMLDFLGIPLHIQQPRSSLAWACGSPSGRRPRRSVLFQPFRAEQDRWHWHNRADGYHLAGFSITSATLEASTVPMDPQNSVSNYPFSQE